MIPTFSWRTSRADLPWIRDSDEERDPEDSEVKSDVRGGGGRSNWSSEKLYSSSGSYIGPCVASL